MKVKDALVKWFLTNARIRHGHPYDDTDVEATVPPKPVPGPVGPKGEAGPPGDHTFGPVAPPDEGAGLWTKKLLPYLLAAATGAGLPFLAYMLSGSDDHPHSPPPSERNGSIYQYLEDGNWHLPD